MVIMSKIDIHLIVKINCFQHVCIFFLFFPDGENLLLD